MMFQLGCGTWVDCWCMLIARMTCTSVSTTTTHWSESISSRLTRTTSDPSPFTRHRRSFSPAVVRSRHLLLTHCIVPPFGLVFCWVLNLEGDRKSPKKSSRFSVWTQQSLSLKFDQTWTSDSEIWLTGWFSMYEMGNPLEIKCRRAKNNLTFFANPKVNNNTMLSAGLQWIVN